MSDSAKQANLTDKIGEGFNRIGSGLGPLAGPALQTPLFMLGGYGLGRGLGHFLPRVNAHRLGVLSGLLAGGVPWAAHSPYLWSNAQEAKKDPEMSWYNPMEVYRALNQWPSNQFPAARPEPPPPPPEMEKPQSYDATPMPGNVPGFGVPMHSTMSSIAADPYLDPIQKSKALNIVSRAAPQRSGIISWPTISQAAVGAGVGFTSATLFGKALDTVFGGLSAPTQRKLQQAGTLAGILINTGAL